MSQHLKKILILALGGEGGGTLTELLWAGAGDPDRAPIESMSAAPAITPEGTALSKSLKKLGFRFVGPTTVYSTMQSLGVVNDHLAGCWVRDDCEAERDEARRRLPDSSG